MQIGESVEIYTVEPLEDPVPRELPAELPAEVEVPARAAELLPRSRVKAPDYFEPVTGWRVWLVARERGEFRLTSVMYPTLWIPGREEIAVCRPADPGRERPASLPHREPHRSPHLRCGCGIYAAKSVDHAASYFDGALPAGDAPIRVIGRVSLWGTVIEGEVGYRASHAYPSRLYVPALDPDGADGATSEEIAFGLAAYRVPVELPDGLSRACVADALAA